MYLPAAFEMDDGDVHEFIDAVRLAHLVTVVDGAPVSSMLPMLYRPLTGTAGSLVGHVARANRHWRAVAPTRSAAPSLAIFAGPDAYVSPSYYPTKRETGEVVPTWNYEVVHVHGELIVHDDIDWVHEVVTQLTDRQEADRPQPWSVDDAPPAYIATMARGIVGVELLVSRIEGKRKLSQNRSAADIGGVIEALQHGNDGERAVARAMRRP